MEIVYSLQPDDYHALERYHRKHRQGRIQPPLLAFIEIPAILFLGCGIAIGLPILLPTSHGQDDVVWCFLGFYSGMIWAAFFYRRYAYWINRANIKLDCEDRLNRCVTLHTRMIVSPAQLRTISSGEESSYHWSAIRHIAEAPNHVFLYIARRFALVVPRRAFRDAAHYAEFVDLVRQYKQESGGREPKPTGIITSLPPNPTAITTQNEP